ncbi:Uu.00g011370.m01.CDS01 [Anthostomella pinea]|uniref:Uu.00g011370.m01.CDS01 n=1 Tax=Anthostomella pinea TaxID=933095 RepID=A0AAI8VYZ8_9PEZI|nr:Uu.00g011370.m01.CDS01 [Anthostomella pinea]
MARRFSEAEIRLQNFKDGINAAGVHVLETRDILKTFLELQREVEMGTGVQSDEYKKILRRLEDPLLL